MWSLLPDSILHQLGIYYYPDRYESGQPRLAAFTVCDSFNYPKICKFYDKNWHCYHVPALILVLWSDWRLVWPATRWWALGAPTYFVICMAYGVFIYYIINLMNTAPLNSTITIRGSSSSSVARSVASSDHDSFLSLNLQTNMLLRWDIRNRNRPKPFCRLLISQSIKWTGSCSWTRIDRFLVGPKEVSFLSSRERESWARCHIFFWWKNDQKQTLN